MHEITMRQSAKDSALYISLNNEYLNHNELVLLS